MRNQKKLQKAAAVFVFLFSIISTLLHAEEPKPTPRQDVAMTPGLIVLTGFEGDVKIATAQNPVGLSPASGAKLQKGDIILTGPNSSASLAFSNGSVLQVQSSSKFSIEEYLQKPWDFDEAAFKKLEKEPTSSQTKLKLDYGDVICNVKKLSATSEMTVSTPLGVAGIRGTTFKLAVRLDSKGKPLNSKLSVVEGAVAFSSKPGESKPPIITGGSTSTVAIDSSADRSGGQVVTVVFSAPLTLKDSAEITRIVTQIAQQVSEFVMSAITAQEEVKKKEDEKKSGEGERKPEDGENKEGDEKKTQIDLSKLPPPDTGAEKSSEKAALNAAASKAQAEIEAKAEAKAKTEAKAKAEAEAKTINKKDQIITLPAIGAKTYGDAAFPLNAKTDSNLTLSYSSSDEAVATVGAAGVVTIKSNGTATITARQAGNGNYNAATSATATLTVGKKALTVSGAAVKSKIYDGTAVAEITGAQLVGVIAGDDVDVSDSDSSAAFADSNVGENKPVTTNGVLTGAQASRYTLTQPTGLTGSITKAPVTITAASANKTFGESDPTLTYTPNPTVLIAGNSFSGSLTRAAGENAGTYAINQGTLSAGDNYAITFVGATFTINNINTTPVLSGFGLTPSSITYGDNAPTITSPISESTGAITYTSSDTSVATISGSTIVIVGVGTTTITASQAASGSFNAAVPVTALLTVSPKALTITGASVASKTYDGTTTATITGSLSGVVGSDAVTLTLSGTFADANAGTIKSVTSSSTLAGAQASRYTLTQPIGLAGTIMEASVTVIAASANKTWNGTDPVLTYTATPSLIEGNSFTGSLTRDSGEDAGTYSITIGSLSAGANYAITFQPATFTINKDGVKIATLTGFNLDNHRVNSNGTRTVRIIAPTSNSPAPITYSLNPSGAGSINGSAVTLTAPCTISAKQEAGIFNEVEYSAASASITLKWEKAIDEEFISNK